MASFITGEEREDLSNARVGVFETSSQLLVEKESRELGSARAFQELNEDLTVRALDFISSGLEGVVTDEMLLVVITAELVEHRV